MNASNPLRELAAQGQSIWYDQLTRSLLESGELARLIREDDLRGMTSNPAIFEKSIGSDAAYGAALAALAREGRSAFEIYDALTVSDVAAACDVFRPVYDRTGGRDGYVSLEVNPELAHDTAGTVSEALRLFRTLGRPNAMIKVPATPEGLSAVEELIAAGVNVNVTLIFSIETYRRTAEAYIRGIERRKKAGLPVDLVASVASFFVSRIDSAVDKKLEALMTNPSLRSRCESLLGKAAVANARIAYAEFERLFHTTAFASLGARVQRPLWASTGTKNARYSDVLYVEELIGPDTVNTVPPATYDAFRDHGRVAARIADDLEGMKRVFRELEGLGIRLDEVTASLAREGVAAFVDSFAKLMAIIEERRKAA